MGDCFLVFFIINQYCRINVILQKTVFQPIGKQMKCTFSIVLLMLCYEKCVFKASENLLVVYSATFVTWKKKHKQKRRATFQIRRICVQNKRGLSFSFLSYFYSTKNVCLKKMGPAFFSSLSYFCNSETCLIKSSGRLLFLVYSVNFVIQKDVYIQWKCIFKRKWRLYFSLLMINRYYTPKIFLLQVL